MLRQKHTSTGLGEIQKWGQEGENKREDADISTVFGGSREVIPSSQRKEECSLFTKTFPVWGLQSQREKINCPVIYVL